MIHTTSKSDTGIETIRWLGDGIRIIDQRTLPAREEYLVLTSIDHVVDAIRTLAVRGAPAIGIAAVMGVALQARILTKDAQPTRESFLSSLDDALSYLASSRPTAKNLFWALERMRAVAHTADGDPRAIADALQREAVAVYNEDLTINRTLGDFGQELIQTGDRVMTHCNAGALATAGHGTALGVIRSAIAAGKNIGVIACETRPLLQGSRLTTWELTRDNIPVTLITDGMSGIIMQRRMVDMIITGADRIAKNGDTANKIGTYTHAVLAKEHGIPFYIAAPVSTFDPEAETGADIPIEERDQDEVRRILETRISPRDVPVFNPAFDVTPQHFITAFITEKGILYPPFGAAIASLF
ncbi:MAG: S-methyl-5-thioribose-1-phosphate isomerase [Deltaproteobacteria bacterium]|nr:S-methyl-5-thioribose-1-phosphate isomerase [Candidatus Zymogenaceae bacterium]